MKAHVWLFPARLVILLAFLDVLRFTGLGATPAGRTFSTPEAAVAALAAATQTTNRAALHEIFGPASDTLVNPDPVQGAIELAAFSAALNQTNRLVRDSDNRWLLEVGNGRYPFPVPLILRDGGWFFDTLAGREELITRRIGANELSALASIRACAAAQREYASRARDGSEVLKYAQKLLSTPGKKDGLFWPPDLDGEISPLGPLVAFAQKEGYGRSSSALASTPQPYHGYYYRVLTRQGRHAPGGKYSYLMNGNMIGGFALVAWPAEYGNTGIMTFIISQHGRVYQKDLGLRTSSLAAKMREYDPDPSWGVSKD